MSTLHETLAARVRPDFPALRRTIAGRSVAYFDGPGGTQVPRRVVDAVASYLTDHNANDGWSFRTSIETDAIIRAARETTAAFLNAASPDEIVFGNNMTTLTFALARAIGRSLTAGDEIVVTDLDHHANIDPWVALAHDYGAVIRRVPLLDGRAQLDLTAFEGLLNARTRLVAIGLSSNAFGTINPVARMAAAARQTGALVFVDAVHAAAHAALDVEELGADLLAFSAYKVYGPHVGVLYCRDELLERLDVPRLAPQTPRGPRRAESGTLNHEGIAGVNAAITYLADLSAAGPLRQRLVDAMDRLTAEEEALFAVLAGGLRELPDIVTYEPPDRTPRHPTIAFRLRGRAASDVAFRLSDEHGIFVSHGNFYAATAIAQIAADSSATGGVLRAGLSIYSTIDDVRALLEALRTMSDGRSG